MRHPSPTRVRDDLVQYAGEQVTTGPEAEAYASYIDGHLVGIADGVTYAELGAIEREADGAVEQAIESGAPADEVTELEATAAGITGQRDSLFRGETLRGLLLSAFRVVDDRAHRRHRRPGQPRGPAS